MNNILTLSLTDARTPQTVKDANPIILQIHTDATLALAPLNISTPNSINTMIRNTVQTVMKEGAAYKCYFDLFDNTFISTLQTVVAAETQINVSRSLSKMKNVFVTLDKAFAVGNGRTLCYNKIME